MAAPGSSHYYKIRMMYKADFDGNILEKTGQDVDLCIDVLGNLRTCQRPRPIIKTFVHDGVVFTSQEFRVHKWPKDLKHRNFDSIRICEVFWETHCSGLIMVMPATHYGELGAIMRQKQELRSRLDALYTERRELRQMEVKTNDEKNRERTVEKEITDDTKTYARLHLEDRAILNPSKANQPKLDDEEYFALIVLQQEAARQHHQKSVELLENLFTADSRRADFISGIVEKFEKTLLCLHPRRDKWYKKGYAEFWERVAYFVDHGLAIPFALPAFPCKSPNPEKTASRAPDGAEYEALVTLHEFCKEVRTVYPPGALFTIVSDGHVFADCIGVNDKDVHTYTDQLAELSQEIFRKPENNFASPLFNSSPVLFRALHEFFEPTEMVRKARLQTHVEYPIRHPVETKRERQDEENRSMMMSSCAPPVHVLEDDVRNNPHGAMTALYRGFSRFMLDDLGGHPECKNLSKKKRKAVAAKAAFEMMLRNQAYSHLVELVCPQHIRLSIHGHDNAGPKYAVSLLSPKMFRTVYTFNGIDVRMSDNVESQVDHLHIPTPWHNALIEIEGHDCTYIGKAGIVEEELQRPYSPYRADSRYELDHPRGGRYVLRLKTIDERISELEASGLDAAKREAMVEAVKREAREAAEREAAKVEAMIEAGKREAAEREAAESAASKAMFEVGILADLRKVSEAMELAAEAAAADIDGADSDASNFEADGVEGEETGDDNDNSTLDKAESGEDKSKATNPESIAPGENIEPEAP